MMQENEQQDLTVKDVAREMNMNPRTVQRLINGGDLEAYQPGLRSFRVKRSALDEFKRKRQVGGRAHRSKRTTKSDFANV